MPQVLARGAVVRGIVMQRAFERTTRSYQWRAAKKLANRAVVREAAAESGVAVGTVISKANVMIRR